MGGYIFLRIAAGFCDCICSIQKLIPYALKNNRTIILDFILYSRTNIVDLLDFSKYPVPIICDPSRIKEIEYDHVEPACFKDNIYKTAIYIRRDTFEVDGMLSFFDTSKVYPDATLLVYYGWNGGNVDTSLLKFTTRFLDKYHGQLSLLPDKFDSIHLRATDHFDQNLTRDLAKIDDFIKDKPAVYFATDNMSLMESLADKYSQIIKSVSYKKTEETYHSLHHTFGKTDPECLSNALIDMLICASADEFLPSTGGFSRLIQKLHEDKDLLNSLIRS
jgi:hypothetical protein